MNLKNRFWQYTVFVFFYFHYILYGLSGVNAQQFWSLTSDDPMGHLPISDDKGRFVMDLDAAAFQNTLTNSKGINFLVGKDQVGNGFTQRMGERGSV